MSDSTRELEDWQDLVQSPGWLRFVNHVKDELASMVGPQLERVADDPDDAKAAGKLRQLVATKKQIERVMAYPQERTRFLQQPPAQTWQSGLTRGGV